MTGPLTRGNRAGAERPLTSWDAGEDGEVSGYFRSASAGRAHRVRYPVNSRNYDCGNVAACFRRRAANQIARDIVAPEKQTASFVVFVIQ
jgi:hypothetical protein